MKSKHCKKKNKVFGVSAILLIILVAFFIVFFIKNNSQLQLNEQVVEQAKTLTEDQILELKDSIKINNVTIVGRTTGTEPFTQVEEGEEIPEVPGPGEDYSPTDNYVRALDIVTYSLNVTTAPNAFKEGITDSTILYGGIIKVKASIPNQGENPLMTWELDAWMENAQLSEDGTELYAEFTISDDQMSSQKTQQLTFSFRVGGEAKEVNPNQTPTFEVWMDGNKPDNEESQAPSVTIKDNISASIQVSASQDFNIKISKGDLTQKWTNETEDGTSQNGYYMNYGVAIGMAQRNKLLTDLRGLEKPIGTFEVKLKLDYSYSNGVDWIPVNEDTENSLGPANGTSLVGYSINGVNSSTFWPRDSIVVSNLPNGNSNVNPNNPERNVYNSGDITVSQDGDIITITFENYEIGDVFPTESRNGNSFGDLSQGYFAVGNLEIFSPFYNEDSETINQYQLNISVIEATFSTASVTNKVITTNEDTNTIDDVNISDNRINYAMTRELDLQVGYNLQVRNEKNGLIETEDLNGDGIRGLGDEVIVKSSYNAYDGPYEGGTERIITWSSDILELKKYNDTAWYAISESSSLNLPFASQENIKIKYGIYKLEKNKGITDDGEVNNAEYDDFLWYDTAEEALEIGKIAAVYMDDPDYNGYRNNRILELKFNVIEDEGNIGRVAVVRHKAKLYEDKERTKISHEIGKNYSKTKYNEEGIIIATHTSRYSGNSILIIQNKVGVKNTTTDLSSAGVAKKNYNIDDGIVNYQITPTLTNDRQASDADSYIDKVVVTNYLPSGLTYKATSSNKEPESVVVDPETGETIITWVYENWQVNRPAPDYPSITFAANIDVSIQNNAQLENRTVIFTKNDYRDEEEYRTAIYGILIANLSSLQGTQDFSKDVVEIGEGLISNLTIQNYSQVQLKNVRALQILPYNGDENGSDFVGTYNIEVGTIPQGMQAYYTEISIDLLEKNAGVSRDDFDRLNPANINFDTTTAWTKLSGGETLSRATAIVLVQDVLAAREEATFSYEIIPNNNEPNSKYIVSSNLIATGFPSVLKTNLDIGIVVQRTIDGTVWYDGNEDGLMNDYEARASNISIDVIDSTTDQIAKDVFGKDLSNIVTDENGNYKVVGLAKGEYKVRFTIPDNTQVTAKGKGNDNTVNSKVNTNIIDGKAVTDTLTNLNIDDLENLENEQYINLGLIKETGTVEIQYITRQLNDDGTEEEIQIADSEIITGPIGAEFDISNKEKIISNYIRTDDDFNKNGTFTVDKQTIKIYYEKIPNGTVVVKHILVNPDLTEELLETEYMQGNIGEEYSTSRLESNIYIPSKLMPDTENTTGLFTDEPIEVNYYYEKIPGGKVTVRYVRKQILSDGGIVEIQLASPVILNGYVGEKFTTTKMDIDGYSIDTSETLPSETGTFTTEEQVITYYYAKPETGTVTIRYVEKVYNADTGSYEEKDLIEPTTLVGYIDEEYRTERKPINNYRATEPEPNNTTGKFSSIPITVTYYYELLPKGTLTVIYEDIYGNLMKDENDQEVQPITTTEYIGKGYNCVPKAFKGYSVVVQPDNYKGTYTETPQTVRFIYDKNTYNYRIEYYFENENLEYEVDDTYTVRGKAKYEDIIDTYDKIERIGYSFVKVEGAPLQIGVSENNNVIKLYYDRNTYNYSVEYYYENDNGELIKQNLTEYGTSKYGYDITEYVDKNIPGYYLKEKENYPLNITEKEEDNIMKLYYYKQDATINVQYIDIDSNEEISNAENVYGKVGQEYDVTDKKKDIENYQYVGDSENLSGYFLELPEDNNTITVKFYYKKTGKVITKYVEIREQEKHDEEGNPILDPDTGKPIIEEVEVEIFKSKLDEKIIGEFVTVSPIAITNYTLLDGQSDQSIEVVDGEKIVKYYYTGKAGGTIENHIDYITGDILEQISHEGRQGDYYKYDSKTFDGYDLVETELPDNAEGYMQEDTIEVNYYYIKKAKVIVEYIDEISNEKILVDGKELTEEIYGHEKDEYTTEKKEIEGYIYTRTDGNETGEMNVIVNIDQDGNKTYNNITKVIYFYKKRAGGVIERHIDILSGEIIEENTHEGKENDSYNVNSKEFTGYDLVDSKLPSNAEGNMTVEPIIVEYYYIKEASVKVKYIDKGTNKEIADAVIIEGHEDDEYTSDKLDIDYYRLINEPNNKEGKMTAEIIKNDDGTVTVNNVTEVIYYYERLRFNFKIDQNVTDIKLNGEKVGINNGKLEKLEISINSIYNSNVEITYEVKVTNDSEIKGTANIFVNIPEGLEIIEAEGWSKNNDGLTRKVENLKPSESKVFTIKLRWEYGKNETGIKTNIAEIKQTLNDANFEEVETEDNTSTTEVVISASTGGSSNTGLKITFVALIIIAITIIQIKKHKRK